MLCRHVSWVVWHLTTAIIVASSWQVLLAQHSWGDALEDEATPALLPPPDLNSTTSEEEQLALALLDRCPILGTTVRPVRFSKNPVEVTAKFQIIKFGGIQDALERFTIYGFLNIQWRLPTCSSWQQDPNWNHILRIRPVDFARVDSSTLGIPIWYPVIWQPNNDEDVFSPVHFASSNDFITLYLDSSGIAGYDAPGKYVSTCDLTANITKFPFDVATCNLIFQAYSPTLLVNLTNIGFHAITNLSQADDGVNFPENFMPDSAVWSLESMFYSQSVVAYGLRKYNRFEYAFVFKRKPESYVINIFLPASALFVLMLAAFVVPPRHAERSEYSLAAVMNFFLLQSVVGNLLPQSSESTHVSRYLFGLLSLGTINTVFFCVTNRLARREKIAKRLLTVPYFGHCFLLNFVDTTGFCLSLTAAVLINAITYHNMMTD